MNNKMLLIIFAAAIISLAISCTDRQGSSLKTPNTAQTGNELGKQTSSNETWQINWESVLQKARKEGKVVAYVTSLGSYLKEVNPLFNKKFGVTIEIVSRRGGELMTSLTAERKAGIFMADILITGTNTFYGESEPLGLAEPLEPMLILPENLDTKNWYGGQPHWVDKEHKALNMYAAVITMLAINTDMVKKGEISSYLDLLNPRWKGKIIMNDPTVAGIGLKAFSVLAYHILDLDYFRQLAMQEPVIIRDQRLQVDWLSKGKYPILLFPRTSDMTEFQEAGAPVAFVMPREGSYLGRDGGAVSLVKRAPHPNAAQLLINWIFSKEGMTLISRSHGFQSARTDISLEGIEPLKIRQPGVNYFTEADSKEWLSRDPEFTKAAMDIFGRLIK